MSHPVILAPRRIFRPQPKAAQDLFVPERGGAKPILIRVGGPGPSPEFTVVPTTFDIGDAKRVAADIAEHLHLPIRPQHVVAAHARALAEIERQGLYDDLLFCPTGPTKWGITGQLLPRSASMAMQYLSQRDDSRLAAVRLADDPFNSHFPVPMRTAVLLHSGRDDIRLVVTDEPGNLDRRLFAPITDTITADDFELAPSDIGGVHVSRAFARLGLDRTRLVIRPASPDADPPFRLRGIEPTRAPEKSGLFVDLRTHGLTLVTTVDTDTAERGIAPLAYDERLFKVLSTGRVVEWGDERIFGSPLIGPAVAMAVGIELDELGLTADPNYTPAPERVSIGRDL